MEESIRSPSSTPPPSDERGGASGLGGLSKGGVGEEDVMDDDSERRSFGGSVSPGGGRHQRSREQDDGRGAEDDAARPGELNDVDQEELRAQLLEALDPGADEDRQRILKDMESVFSSMPPAEDDDKLTVRTASSMPAQP